MDERLLYSHHLPLCLHVECDMAGELCGSSLRQQILRQVSVNQSKITLQVCLSKLNFVFL